MKYTKNRFNQEVYGNPKAELDRAAQDLMEKYADAIYKSHQL
jgi:hypothetical protein